ncbi:MAG: Lrp/AsnC ligand binding domain-containing protein [Theionarchaea archaeon]|nr:Lrp/AsnC ligand binding domain-containing protein [Theionarchaea archaeon]
MVSAYVLITIAIGKVKEVLEELNGMQGVVKADVVTGPYDAIALIEAEDLSQLTKTIVQKIHYIEGVIDTTTAIVVQF